MNLDKDPSSWATVSPDAVLSGSEAQRVNVLAMAKHDIAALDAEVQRLKAKRSQASASESTVGHNIIARLFDLPVRDMGAGLRIMYPKPAYLTVEERDLIVKAIHAYVR